MTPEERAKARDILARYHAGPFFPLVHLLRTALDALEQAERALVKQHTRAEQIETNLRAWVRVAQFDASDEELLERAHNAFRNLTETADDDGGCEHQDEFLCSACERRMFVLTLLPVLVKVRKEQAALREG